MSEFAEQKMENLPREIVIDILSRLPIKPLVRCRCVCKFWLNLIHDSRLVNLHLHRASQPNDDNNSVLVLDISTPRKNAVNFCGQFFFVENDEPDNYTPLKLNVPLLFEDFRVMGSCNGLLCLYNSMDRFIVYVCNPCNGDYIKLPEPIMSMPRPLDFVGGFGFDQKTNQYKVVMIVYCYGHGPGRMNPQWQSEVHVYNLGDSSWRHIGEAPYLIFDPFGSKAFVNGAHHWVSSSPGKPIVSFDIADEVFDVVSCPKFGLGEGSNSPGVLRGQGDLSLVDSEFGLGDGSYSLGMLRGHLSLVNSSFKDRIEIWVMNNYGVKESWTKYFTINFSEVGRSVRYIQVLCFQKNGEVLLLYDRQALLSYNPRTVTLRKVSIVGLPTWFDAVTYVGTLISPLRLSEENERIG